MFKRVTPILMCIFGAGSIAAEFEGPALGIPASESEIKDADITIMPDGENLPPGSGSAKFGQEVFNQQCVSCHGVDGVGGINDVLVGGLGSLTSATPVQTVGSYWPYATTIFDYVRRAMPYNAPGSLSNDEVYAVAAFLLYKNGVIKEDERMDATSMPRVRMPNRDNFDWAYKVK